MTTALAPGIALAALASLLTVGFGSQPAVAGHNDWGLPLVGGLVGGAGLSALYFHSREQSQTPRQESYLAPPPTTYVTPVVPVAPAAPAAPSAATIEHELNVLDDLAAKGYITKQEYQDRRQALLNQL
jgi:multisubunit Na+/H+ antiporter MnhB subunit